jgi:hypothetical protein
VARGRLNRSPASGSDTACAALAPHHAGAVARGDSGDPPDGVLSISVPKKPASQPRKMAINTSESAIGG